MCLDQECTFQPDIGATKYRPRDVNHSVIERLSQPMHSSREHAEEVKSRADMRDPKTGQRFFKPKIGRPNKNRPKKDVGTLLYEQGQDHLKKLEKAK